MQTIYQQKNFFEDRKCSALHNSDAEIEDQDTDSNSESNLTQNQNSSELDI